MQKFFYCLVFFSFAFIALSLVGTAKVSAATSTWTGNNSNAWSDDDNWDVPPQEGDDLVFPYEPVDVNMNCDMGTTSFNSLSFDDSYSVSCANIFISGYINQPTAHDLVVNAQITLEDDILINSAGVGTYNQAINLNGHTLTLDSNNPYLIINSIAGTGNVLKQGNNIITMTGTSTFTGELTVHSGTLSINLTNGLSSVTDLEVESAGQITFANSTENTLSTLSGEGTVRLGTGAGAILNIDSNSDNFQFDGEFVGTGSIVKSGSFSGGFNGDSPSFDGGIDITESALGIDGDFSDTDITLLGGSLTGIGTVHHIFCINGGVSPGHSGIGILNTTGNFNLSPDCIFSTFLLGTEEGVDYAQVVAAGSVTLGSALLSINTSYTVLAGDEFIFVKTTGGELLGQFQNAPNDTISTLGGQNFLANYYTNRVVLTKPSVGLFNTSFTSDPEHPSADAPFTITSEWLGTGPTPTGTAELFYGSTSLGVVSLIPGTTGALAIFNIDGLPEGDYSFTVEYSGDVNFAPATSDPLELTIGPALAETGIHLSVGFIILALLSSLVGLATLRKRSY